MRVSTFLIALPALASAQQIPFLDTVQPYIDKVTSFGAGLLGQSNTGGSNTAPHPAVTELRLKNWEDTLRYGGKNGPGSVDNWMVYVTGNTTCAGECARPDAAWDVCFLFSLSSAQGRALLTYHIGSRDSLRRLIRQPQPRPPRLRPPDCPLWCLGRLCLLRLVLPRPQGSAQPV